MVCVEIMELDNIVSRLYHRPADNFVNMTELCNMLGEDWSHYVSTHLVESIKKACEARPGVSMCQLGQGQNFEPLWACEEMVFDMLKWSKKTPQEIETLIQKN